MFLFRFSSKKLSQEEVDCARDLEDKEALEGSKMLATYWSTQRCIAFDSCVL